MVLTYASGMKLLLNHEGSYYVVDLDSLKPMTIGEVVTEAGNDSLAIVQTQTLPKTDLLSLLSKALAPAPAPVTPSKPARAKAGKLPYTSAEVRDWARSKGIEVKDQGRIPADVLEQFFTAFPNKKPAS